MVEQVWLIPFLYEDYHTNISVPSSQIFPQTVTKGTGTDLHNVMMSSLKRLQEAYEMSDDDLDN